MNKEDFEFELDWSEKFIRRVSIKGPGLVDSVYKINGSNLVIQIDRKDRTMEYEWFYEIRVTRHTDKPPYAGIPIVRFEKAPSQEDFINVFNENQRFIISLLLG